MAKINSKYPPIPRLMTDFYSLNHAFINDIGELGVPVGHLWEVFGTTHLGKSTFIYSLTGNLATIQKRNIVLCDFEGLDTKFLERITKDFPIEITLTREVEDEDQVDKTMSLLADDDYCIGIVDGISAVSPISEQQGDTGEVHMGRRAFIIAQLNRKAMHICRMAEKEPKTLFMISHWIPKMGTRGYDAPGGVEKSFFASIRILLKRVESFPDGSYVLQGEVKKNRWGFEGRNFYVFMLMGKGIHKGLTALYDCVILEKASYKNGIVKMNDENLGRMSKFVKGAHEGNDELFECFYKALAENQDTGSEQEQDFVGTTDIIED